MFQDSCLPQQDVQVGLYCATSREEQDLTTVHASLHPEALGPGSGGLNRDILLSQSLKLRSCSHSKPESQGNSRKQWCHDICRRGISSHNPLFDCTPPPKKINRNGTTGVLCLLSCGAPKRNKSFTMISPSRPWVFFLLLPIFRDSIWSSIFQKRSDSQANTSRIKGYSLWTLS